MKGTGRLCRGLLRRDSGKDEPAGDTSEGTTCHRRGCEVDRDGGESSGGGRSPSGKGHASNVGRRQGLRVGGKHSGQRRGSAGVPTDTFTVTQKPAEMATVGPDLEGQNLVGVRGQGGVLCRHKPPPDNLGC